MRFTCTGATFAPFGSQKVASVFRVENLEIGSKKISVFHEFAPLGFAPGYPFGVHFGMKTVSTAGETPIFIRIVLLACISSLSRLSCYYVWKKKKTRIILPFSQLLG